MDTALLCRAAVRVVRGEGVPALVVRTWRFVCDVLNRIICVKRVYIYRFDLADLDSCPTLAIPPGFETRFVASNGDADSLAAQGYEDFRDRFLRARDSLSTGAVALCAYRGERLAHIGWVARDFRTKWRFDDVPYPVDFERGESCLGSVFTLPEYRGRGLASHSIRLRLEYLHSVDCLTTLAAVQTDNTASLRALSRVGLFSRRTLLHVKLPGINYIRHVGVEEHVLMERRRAENAANTGNEEERTCADD
ncbi:GNAT family N-acetyltransferase [Chloroflexota bacterium]